VWDPYSEGQVIELDQVLKKVAEFANHNESVCETLAQRSAIARICAFFKVYPENGHGELLGTGYKDHAT